MVPLSVGELCFNNSFAEGLPGLVAVVIISLVRYSIMPKPFFNPKT